MNKFIKTFFAIKSDNTKDMLDNVMDGVKSVLFILFFATCMVIGLWGIAEFIGSIF